ncbi:unnamed protein product [Cuscuta epithymum]|uniref:Uncharacterized protein n=1 Tax=Cuscuta epithymum TaxID=186058 RepID=A0AAV0ER94_9ASTE|nr:unnamed protein product [Cuscuta epithymum]
MSLNDNSQKNLPCHRVDLIMILPMRMRIILMIVYLLFLFIWNFNHESFQRILGNMVTRSIASDTYMENETRVPVGFPWRFPSPFFSFQANHVRISSFTPNLHSNAFCDTSISNKLFGI